MAAEPLFVDGTLEAAERPQVKQLQSDGSISVNAKALELKFKRVRLKPSVRQVGSNPMTEVEGVLLGLEDHGDPIHAVGGEGLGGVGDEHPSGGNVDGLDPQLLAILHDGKAEHQPGGMSRRGAAVYASRPHRAGVRCVRDTFPARVKVELEVVDRFVKIVAAISAIAHLSPP